jgi:RNA polymerase sigma-B factor
MTPRTCDPRTPSDERELFARYQQSHSGELRDQLVAEHAGLAIHLANRYAGRGIERDDLQQVALIALVGAVERFDPDRGVSFSSFAVPTIAGSLKRQFRQMAWSVRPPRAVQERSLAVAAAVDALEATLGRAPTTAELGAYGRWSEHEVTEALGAREARLHESLDEDHHRPIDRHALDALTAIDDRTVLERLLAALEPLDRTIMHLYYAEDLTQREIGRLVGVCQMQVSRRIARSVERMRAVATAA